MLELPLIIDAPFIEGLIDEKKEESKILEYKSSLQIVTPQQKEELCRDVTAFANAAGGLILYGIEEEKKDGKCTGIPESVCGLGGMNAETEIRRVQEILLRGIDPRLTPPVHITAHTANGEQVMALRIFRSWSSPHMIRTDDSRFWVRVSRSREPLDANAIGAAFLATSERTSRIERFRDDRLGKILSNEGPRPMEDAPKVVLHVLPLAVAEKPPVLLGVDLRPKAEQAFGRARDRRNLDGVVFFGPNERGCCEYYVQVFRTGAVEAVTAQVTSLGRPSNRFEGRPHCFYVDEFERWVIDKLQAAVAFVKSCDLQPPVLVFVALLGLKGLIMYTKRGECHDDPKPFDRDVLTLPESVLQDFSDDVAQRLKTDFDLVWEAANYGGSRWYGPDGKRQ
jgi:hypothetical protein